MSDRRRRARRLGTLARLEEKREDKLSWRKKQNVERIVALRRIKADEAMQCPIGCGGSVHPEHELDDLTVDEWDQQLGKSIFLPDRD